MPLTNAITEVKNVIAAVSGVGKVNTYRRAVNREEDFQDVYVDGGKVKGWDITRESTPSVDRTVGATEERHLLVIRGYMSVNDKDGSEPTFQALIESVRAALRGNRNLNGSVLDSTPCSARLVGAATFGPQQVLVHYCELTLEAIEFPLSTT